MFHMGKINPEFWQQNHCGIKCIIDNEIRMIEDKLNTLFMHGCHLSLLGTVDLTTSLAPLKLQALVSVGHTLLCLILNIKFPLWLQSRQLYVMNTKPLGILLLGSNCTLLLSQLETLVIWIRCSRCIYIHTYMYMYKHYDYILVCLQIGM